MTSLTTRQRDILKILLEADQPLATDVIAHSVQLSARQVNYSMKGLKQWLNNRDAVLRTTPGVGVIIECQPGQRMRIVDEIEKPSRLQIVLTPEQRQQLICCLLLFETEPMILTQLTHIAKVSRTTIFSDLDIIESWYDQWGISLERKQNYGIWVKSSEKLRQQAVLAFFWGDAPFGKSLFEVSFQNGLVFSMNEDAHFLPLVEKTNIIMHMLNLKSVFNKVVLVEDILGGRFADDAVLFLALVLSVLVARTKLGFHINVSQQEIAQLEPLPVWHAASKMLQNLWKEEGLTWEEGSIAYVAMYILALPRHERWPSEPDQENHYKDLFVNLLDEIRGEYETENLHEDLTLRDGIVNHLIPVFNQHKFQLWKPKLETVLVSRDKYVKEYAVASKLATIIKKHTFIELPPQEIGMLAALLRASYIRLQPHHFRNVLVVCPAGMATAQLLTARLSTKFPRLGKLTVISYRELDQHMIARADFIITMMPLPNDLVQNKPIVQVSPQLLPEDVEAITSFLG